MLVGECLFEQGLHIPNRAVELRFVLGGNILAGSGVADRRFDEIERVVQQLPVFRRDRGQGLGEAPLKDQIDFQDRPGFLVRGIVLGQKVVRHRRKMQGQHQQQRRYADDDAGRQAEQKALQRFQAAPGHGAALTPLKTRCG